MSENNNLPDLNSGGKKGKPWTPPKRDNTRKVASEKSDTAKTQTSKNSKKSDDYSKLFVNKKQNRKNYLIIAGAVILAILILLAFLLFDPFGYKKNTSVMSGEEQSKNTVAIDSTTQVTQNTEDAQSGMFYLEEGRMIPFENEEWQNDSYENNQDKSIVVNNYAESGVLDGLGDLPSELAGYTSNTDEASLEDGTPNPLYSYWTKETIETEVSNILEIILNPIYGNWFMFQGQTDISALDLYDYSYLLTPELIDNEELTIQQKLPFYADWNGDNYGGRTDLVNAARWFGQLNSGTSVLTYNPETDEYSINIEANITYTAWTTNEETVTQPAKLILTLVTNQSGDSENRVLISNATLELL